MLIYAVIAIAIALFAGGLDVLIETLLQRHKSLSVYRKNPIF